MYLIDFVFHDVTQLTPEMTLEHRNHLKPHYLSQQLILGGPKHPRTGGIILSNHRNDAEVRRLLDSDPLVQKGLASYSLIEFHPVMMNEKFIDLVKVD